MTNRMLVVLNLIGILILAGLCAAQWNVNRRDNLARLALENKIRDQQTQLDLKDQAILGQNADLDDFRARVAKLDDALKQAQAAGEKAGNERGQAAAQRDQLQTQLADLKTTLNQWQAAVADRDQSLKEAQDQLQKAAADRNDAIKKFNDLAAKYNDGQAALQKAGDSMQKLVDDRNDAIKKFNDLATKYNALVKEINPAATSP